MSAPIAFENAYALLTNIQGFNSFSLGPGSSTDEISRAFQTQSLIWHPDKNPGDPQALRIYNRMLRAYETLMDANTRRQHDARIAKGDVTEDAPGDESFDAVPQAPGAPKVPSPENQPPPEDLGAPPPSARPFAYVDKDPGPTTPAAKAGIRRGDALLRIGDASHLRDVQGQLQASLNQPLPVLVIDKKGRFMKKWVVPHSWDQWAPASLLGCQMSDQCPLDLQVSHPAVLAERARRADAARSRTMPAGGDDDSDGEDGDEEEIPVAPRGGKEVSRQAPPTACWARTLLALFSTLGVALGLVLLVWPLYHLQVLDIWGIRDYPCPANETIAANPIVVGPKGYGFDLIRYNVHTVFAGAFVMVCISLLGLILACCRPSCTRGLFTTVYLCAALPSWVTLVFVSVLSFAFKEKTHALVSEYWFCLEMYTATHKHGLTAATAADAGDALYKHTEMAAAFCVTSAVSLLFSMLCLCRTILWHAHACARQTVFYIAICTFMIGLIMLSGGVFLEHQKYTQIYFNVGVVSIGAFVVIVSLIGACGAHRESNALLRLYTVVLALLLVAVFGVTLHLMIAGPGEVIAFVRTELRQMWHGEASVISYDELELLMQQHLVAIITLLALLIVVLVLDLVMACILSASVSKHGRLYSGDLKHVEMEPLKKEKPRGKPRRGAGRV